MNTNNKKDYLRMMVSLTNKDYDKIINTIEQLNDKETENLYSFVQVFKFENYSPEIFISSLKNSEDVLSIKVSSCLNIIKA